MSVCGTTKKMPMGKFETLPPAAIMRAILGGQLPINDCEMRDHHPLATVMGDVDVDAGWFGFVDPHC